MSNPNTIDQLQQITELIEEWITQVVETNGLCWMDLEYSDVLEIVKETNPTIINNPLFEPLFSIAYEEVTAEHLYDSDQF